MSGLYSSFKIAGGTVYVAGQVPRDDKRQVVGTTVEQQAEVVLEKFKEVLRQAGCSFDDLVKVNVYLQNIGDIDEFNSTYLRAMGPARPARTTISCQLNGVLVEIDGIAWLKQ